jgi:hypothetical protein
MFCRTRRRVTQLCLSLIALSLTLRILFVLLYLHQSVLGIVPMGYRLQGLFASMPAPFFYRMFLYRITFFAWMLSLWAASLQWHYVVIVPSDGKAW